LSYFLQFLHFFISRYFIGFSQHSTYIYLSILSVRFANIFTRLFSNFHPLKFHFYLFVLQTFNCYFLYFTSFLNTEKSRRFRRNFGREVTLKYLIWFRRDNFFILSFSYYFILSCLFLTFYFTLFTLFLFSFFPFIYFIIYFICVL